MWVLSWHFIIGIYFPTDGSKVGISIFIISGSKLDNYITIFGVDIYTMK